MFTSRAEYRILLRQDNADLRLTELGHSLGLANDQRLDTLLDKKNDIANLLSSLKSIKLEPEIANEELQLLNTATLREKATAEQLIRRPHVGILDLIKMNSELKIAVEGYSTEVIEQAEISIKYDSYIDREQKLAEKIEGLEDYKIRPDFDYDRVKALSSEAREKLKKYKPETIGQMSRISGVSPSDVSILTVYLGK
jgi:tRNA uridine 5-carboxymethylaminomethyl modification enzyme